MPSWAPSPPVHGRFMLATSLTPRHSSNCATFSFRTPRPQTHTARRPCPPINAFTSQRHGCTLSFRPSNTSYTRSLHERRPTKTLYLGSGLQPQQTRGASSSSKWVSRQSSDRFSREAKLLNLKSRAAFKLLQINERYRLFRPGMTVVDLGYAPGSWSQVAIDLVRPGLGRVVGVDVIPVQPPKGVNGIQGNFLSPEVQLRVREFLEDKTRGKLRQSLVDLAIDSDLVPGETEGQEEEEAGYVDRERAATSDTSDKPLDGTVETAGAAGKAMDNGGDGTKEDDSSKCVDVVLSDMMMNTTGNKFRDHAGSMDLCNAALQFSQDTLKVGGHFVCKFYQGGEDRQFEARLRELFAKVHREKPESSRSESREAFFVALNRRRGPRSRQQQQQAKI